jgi:DNA-binding MarR family transcriptional regulator
MEEIGSRKSIHSIERPTVRFECAFVICLDRCALGQMVYALEAAGLVASEADPADRRVRRVRRTPRGEEVSATLTTAIEAAERRLRQEVGPRRFDAMKQVMRELGRDLL